MFKRMVRYGTRIYQANVLELQELGRERLVGQNDSERSTGCLYHCLFYSQ